MDCQHLQEACGICDCSGRKLRTYSKLRTCPTIFFSYGLVSCGFRPSACNCSSHLCDCQTASCWDQRCPVRDMAAVLFLRDNGSGPLIRNFVPGYILDLGSSGFISLNTELWCPRPRLWGFLSFESAIRFILV